MILKINMDLAKNAVCQMSTYPLVFGLVSNLVSKAPYIEAFLDFPQFFDK
jgi:hypothetical protein